MNHWTIKVFINDSGRDVIQKWLDDLEARYRKKVQVRVDFMKITKDWKGLIKPRKGHPGIYELVIKSDVQLRPLGFYGPGAGEFTLLIGAIEVNSTLKPIDADKTAESRRDLVSANPLRYTKHYE